MASKSTAAPRAASRPGVLVVDGKEGGETVGGILLHASEREVQLVDESVTHLVAEDELVAPHVQDVSCKVVRCDSLRRTLAGDDLREELGEDVVGRLREARRQPDPPTVRLGSRDVDALEKLVRHDDLEVMGQCHCLRQSVRHSFEHARVFDLLYYVPVLGHDGVVLINNRHPSLTLGLSGRGVAAGARRAYDYREEHSSDESNAQPPQSHGLRT